MADVKLFNLGMNNFTSTGNVTLCVCMSRVRLPLPCFFAGADRSLRSGIPGIQGIAGGIAGMAPLSFLFGQVALKLILLGSTWP